MFASLTLFAGIISGGCKKDKNEKLDTTSTETTNPVSIPEQTTSHAAINLAAASNLAILAGSGITNTGATIITGDMALSPGTSVGGFPPGILNGTLHINDTLANAAKLSLTAAFNDAAGRTGTDMVSIAGNVGGLTLTPGLYKSTSSLELSSGDLTFDAKGNADAVFIIQIASAFTITSDRKMILSGGAKATNIFWQIGSSATFGTSSVLKGTFIVKESISFDTGATLDGRALARSGAITMEGNTITN
jgi:hypothetical protein